MADNYAEDVALFSKSHGRYTEEHEPPPQVGETPTGDEPEGYQRTYQEEQDGYLGRAQQNGSQPGPPKMETQHEGQPDGAGPDEPYAIPPFDEMLCNIHEKAMREVGFGRLQWVMFVIVGLGLMGDGIELLMVAYIFPGAEKDLCMDEQMKGWLGEFVNY